MVHGELFYLIGGTVGMLAWCRRFVLPQGNADQLLIAQAERAAVPIKRTCLGRPAEKAVQGMREYSSDDGQHLDISKARLIPAVILMYRYPYAGLYIVVGDFHWDLEHCRRVHSIPSASFRVWRTFDLCLCRA